MPPVRRNKQLPSSPGEISSGYCYNDFSTPTLQVDSLSLTPEADVFQTVSPDVASSALTKKKRSHGKTKPPGHTPRPPNAFIIFRTEYIKAQAKQNSTPEVSKNLGLMWRNLSPSEKRPWNQKAEEAKRLHKELYPDYKYKPIHRRDEFGNCIRKPRSPNRPRVKKPPSNADMLDHLSGSFQWLEGKPDVEFPNTALPSDASSVSSPPPSPSPAPSLHPQSPSTSHLAQRRSSSVPLAGPDGSFFFSTAPNSAYASSPGFLTGHPRRLSKRPSTSMDFMCAGIGHSDAYGLPSTTETYLSPNDPSLWRLGQRRSISAPDFGGEIGSFTFPSYSTPQEANPLTPINPVFGSLFEGFSWTAPQASRDAYTDFAPTHSFSALAHKEYITVQVPPTSCTTDSPISNLSSATSPQVYAPALQLSSTPAPPIQHPAPVATFDISAFEEQMTQFEFDAAVSQGGYEDPLGVVAQTCLPDGAVYNVDERFIMQAGDDRTAALPVGAASAMPTATQSSTESIPVVRPADVRTVDLQGYQEGVRYTRQHPEIIPPSGLDIHELIVDTY